MSFLASEGGFWPLTASMTSEVKNNYAYVITQDIFKIVCTNIEHPLIIDKIVIFTRNLKQQVWYVSFYGHKKYFNVTS